MSIYDDDQDKEPITQKRMRALWGVIAHLSNDYCDVSFNDLMFRPRYEHLRPALAAAVQAVMAA